MSGLAFRRPEHRIIVEALSAMDGEALLASRCFFGGGTAIVLTHGEYRLSRDLDFLCADAEGYRELRTRAVRDGLSAFFGPRAEAIRAFRVDQYGLRTIFRWRGEPIKFEIVREARLSLAGAIDPGLGVPLLGRVDQFAEKLLANADRCVDRSTARRDAIDLGYLLIDGTGIPAEAVAKAEAAYGVEIAGKIGWVLACLADPAEARAAAQALDMATADVIAATQRLRHAASIAWPKLDVAPSSALDPPPDP